MCILLTLFICLFIVEFKMTVEINERALAQINLFMFSLTGATGNQLAHWSSGNSIKTDAFPKSKKIILLLKKEESY